MTDLKPLCTLEWKVGESQPQPPAHGSPGQHLGPLPLTLPHCRSEKVQLLEYHSPKLPPMYFCQKSGLAGT